MALVTTCPRHIDNNTTTIPGLKRQKAQDPWEGPAENPRGFYFVGLVVRLVESVGGFVVGLVGWPEVVCRRAVVGLSSRLKEVCRRACRVGWSGLLLPLHPVSAGESTC